MPDLLVSAAFWPVDEPGFGELDPFFPGELVELVVNERFAVSTGPMCLVDE